MSDAVVGIIERGPRGPSGGFDQDALDEAILTRQAVSEKGQAGGYASLDGAAKLPVSQLPSSILQYKGTWNATTNTPTLADGSGAAGDVYRVATAGTQNLGSGSVVYGVGDLVIYDGSVWQRSDSAEAVSSVAGKTGSVTLVAADVTDLGTAATKNVPASGDAAAGEVVKGSDTRLSDARTPTDGSVTASKVAASLKPTGSAAAGDESLRALGTSASTAAAGNDSRFPTAGQKNALAGTSGTPGTGNEYATKATTDAEAAARAAQLGLPLGLTGATGATRYVGASNGAPTAGTFAVGDFVIDPTNGWMWICTTAGSPGTWTRVGAGELPGTPYAEITSDFSTATSNAHVDVTGASVTVTCDGGPILLHAFSYGYKSSGTGVHYAFIRESTTDIAYAQRANQPANETHEINVYRRFSPSAGSHTFKVTVFQAITGAGTLAFGGAATSPGFLRATKV